MVCSKCNMDLDINKFKLEDGKIRNYTCKKCIARSYRSKMKLDMLEGLGNVCACCGEDNPVFLTLDHINNDGHTHRETLKDHQIIAEARRENWPKDKYQILCMNCNFAKGHYEECPHKLGQTKEMIYAKLRSDCATTDRSRVVSNTSNVEARVAGRKRQARESRFRALLPGLTEEQLAIVRQYIPK